MALPAAAQVQEAFPSYIQVNGRAEKEITPDEFYLSVIINERDSKGKISVESQQRDMIAALKRLGVNVEKQLKVANLSSEFFKKNTSVATAKYQLQLGSSAMVAKVWQPLRLLRLEILEKLQIRGITKLSRRRVQYLLAFITQIFKMEFQLQLSCSMDMELVTEAGYRVEIISILLFSLFLTTLLNRRGRRLQVYEYNC